MKKVFQSIFVKGKGEASETNAHGRFYFLPF